MQKNTDEFIVWNGGQCPVPKGTLVEFKWRDGIEEKAGGLAVILDAEWWKNDGNDDDDIIGYRIIDRGEISQT